jgi:hypothetical protein
MFVVIALTIAPVVERNIIQHNAFALGPTGLSAAQLPLQFGTNTNRGGVSELEGKYLDLHDFFSMSF